MEIRSHRTGLFFAAIAGAVAQSGAGSIMKHPGLYSVVLGVVAISLGCSSPDGSAALDEHLQTFEAAVVSHGSEIQSMKSLTDMKTHEKTHADATNGMMGDMSADMNGMSMCDSSGQTGGMMGGSGMMGGGSGMMGGDGRMGMDGMMGMMGDAQKECDQHHAAMDAAMDMMMAEKEEMRHQAEMKSLFQKMHDQMGSMGDGTCTMTH
ncbi:MAG: hypothetical protein U0441_05910 [Polyangiaceae bacterium]